MDIKRSPWTQEEVNCLSRYQEEEKFHPYTCECGEKLIPTLQGWACNNCNYTQSWCLLSHIEYYSGGWRTLNHLL